MSIKINDKVYSLDNIRELIANPYYYINGLAKDDNIEHLFDFFINKEICDSENIKDSVNNIIKKKLNDFSHLEILPFLINEYFINEEGSTYIVVYNYIFILLLNICRNLFDFTKFGLNIKYDKINELIFEHQEYIKMFISSAVYQMIWEEDIDTIINKLKTKDQPILFPFDKFKHSMTFMFRYNKNNNNYTVIFMNSGSGCYYHHNTVINNNIYTRAIYEYHINEKIFRLFLVAYSNSYINTSQDFYNNIIFILESKSLQCNIDKQIIEMQDSDKIDKYYYEPQYTGDCTMRSFILPLYYYSKVMYKQFNNFFSELLFLLRVVLFLNISLVAFKNNDSTIYHIFTYAYFSLKQYMESINIMDIFDLIELKNCIDKVYLDKLNMSNNSNDFSNIF
jgi:hypothetical protein